MYSIEKTIDGSYQLNKTKLEKCSSLLIHFLESSITTVCEEREDREVQCLHVIKRVIVELEHPSGCLHDILTCLYDSFVLSKKGFFKWREDTDPLEQEGKGEIGNSSGNQSRCAMKFKNPRMKIELNKRNFEKSSSLTNSPETHSANQKFHWHHWQILPKLLN